MPNMRRSKEATSMVDSPKRSVVMEQLLEMLLEKFESLEAEYPSVEQSEFCLRLY